MMKKRLLAAALAGTMVLSMAGCSGSSSGTAQTQAPATSAQSTEAKKEESKAEEGKKEEAKAEQPAAGSWTPDHDITIRVPNAAGGTMDTLSRIVGQGLQEKYGKTVMVNNITGANGAIAAADLLSKDADPCEMMTAGISLFTLAPLFNKDIKVNLDDFTFISALVSEDFMLFTAPGNSGISTWEELVEYSKSNRILFGSNTPGGTTHMLGTALFGAAGIDAEAVTSDGSAKDLLALSGGNVTCAIAGTSVAEQYVEEGTIVPLVVFSKDEFKGYDGFTVPTAQSLGYDIVFRSCNFLMTRAGVDQAAVDDIYQSIVEYYGTDEYKELAANANAETDDSDGAAVRKTIEDAAAMCQEIYDTYYAK